MEVLKPCFLGICGFSFGVAVAGGYLALISMIGILPRLASTSKTVKYILTYENAIVYGVLWGNILSLYDIPLPGRYVTCILTGLFGGVFIGCLAGALAEVVNVIPIFTRRMNLRTGIPYLIYSLALGKGIFIIIQYFILGGRK